MTDNDRRLRADAQINRDRILDVARAALAADPEASLNAIAKTAGVGAGTLYRHFPSREALVVALYRKEIDALAALAPGLLAEAPPLEAIRSWCVRVAVFGRIKHGVADLLRAALSDEDSQETYRLMVGAMTQLLAAGQITGDVRSDADPEDVLVVLAGLWRLPPTPVGEARAERILAMITRGLTSVGPPDENDRQDRQQRGQLDYV